jgi:hypothetical protein
MVTLRGSEMMTRIELRRLVVVGVAVLLGGCGTAGGSESRGNGPETPAGDLEAGGAQGTALCELPAVAYFAGTTLAPNFARASLHHDAASGACAVTSGTASPLVTERGAGLPSSAGNYCEERAPSTSSLDPEQPPPMLETPTGLLEFTFDPTQGYSVFGFHPATYRFVDAERASSRLEALTKYHVAVQRAGAEFEVMFELGAGEVIVHSLQEL